MTWHQQLEIARTADELGMEAIVPVGRWTGFRGNTNSNGICFETYTWAAGIAQATENIGVFTPPCRPCTRSSAPRWRPSSTTSPAADSA